MTSVASVITQARHALVGSSREQRNRLSIGVDTDDTTLTLEFDLNGIGRDHIVEVGSELMFVWGVSSASKTLTVERGYLGTTPAAHALGAGLTVNPKFPRSVLLASMNAELADLSSPRNGLFRVATVETEYDNRTRMLTIPGSVPVLRVLSVWWREGNRDWYEVPRFRVARNQDTDDISSGIAVILDDGARTGPVRIVHTTPFASVAEDDDLEVDGGLPASAVDIVALGVQLRSMVSREVPRNHIEAQGDTRRPDEVGPGAVQQSWQGLSRLRRERIQAESTRLKQMYPLRSTR